MGRLDEAKSRFQRRIGNADDFVTRAGAARRAHGTALSFVTSQREWVYELALLKVMVASEEFFETTLGLFALGERTATRYRPHRRHRMNMSLPAMLNLLRGDQDFVGWNDPNIITRRAQRWFRDGEPYSTALTGASQTLGYLRIMRNCIAHESDSAYEKYTRQTRHLYGATPSRPSPGTQLMRAPPPAIPYLIGGTLFEAAINVYRAIASQIVR